MCCEGGDVMDLDFVGFVTALTLEILGIVTAVILLIAGGTWVATGTDSICIKSGYQKIQAEAK